MHVCFLFAGTCRYRSQRILHCATCRFHSPIAVAAISTAGGQSLANARTSLCAEESVDNVASTTCWAVISVAIILYGLDSGTHMSVDIIDPGLGTDAADSVAMRAVHRSACSKPHKRSLITSLLVASSYLAFVVALPPQNVRIDIAGTCHVHVTT